MGGQRHSFPSSIRKYFMLKMMPQVLSAFFLALVTFGTDTTRASPLPQDTGSSIGGLFGSLLVGLGERAVQEGLVDRLQELGVAGGQAVLENGVLGQIQDQAVSNLPTSDQVIDALPSSDQVIEVLPTDQVVNQVRGSLPTTDQVVEQVGPSLPTAQQIGGQLLNLFG